MEVRKNTFGEGKLSLITCISGEDLQGQDGFNVASVIIEGEKSCMVVDTQWVLSNAHRVVAEIYSTGKPLTDIYLTHGHPDHYFGTQVFTAAFPEATVWALPETAEVIEREFMPKIDHWKQEVGDLNCPDKAINMKVIDGDFIEFEGNRIEFRRKVWGDMKWNSMVYIPSIKALICSDVVFNESHPFTCELTPKGRARWIEDAKKILDGGWGECDIIIPGHAKIAREFNESGPKYTIDYVQATIDHLAETDDQYKFFYLMERDFFMSWLRKSNDMNANVILGDRPWDWPDLEDHDDEI
jgi:glyoxylase-like metal-dependent hydrolase (beta-lactamase superfamily II)